MHGWIMILEASSVCSPLCTENSGSSPSTFLCSICLCICKPCKSHDMHLTLQHTLNCPRKSACTGLAAASLWSLGIFKSVNLDKSVRSPLLHSVLYANAFLQTVSPKLYSSRPKLQMWSHKCHTEGKYPFPGVILCWDPDSPGCSLSSLLQGHTADSCSVCPPPGLF